MFGYDVFSSPREQTLQRKQAFSNVLRLSLHFFTYSIYMGKLYLPHHERKFQLMGKLCFNIFTVLSQMPGTTHAQVSCKMLERGKKRPFLSPCLMQGWHHSWTKDSGLPQHSGLEHTNSCPICLTKLNNLGLNLTAHMEENKVGVQYNPITI